MNYDLYCVSSEQNISDFFCFFVFVKTHASFWTMLSRGTNLLKTYHVNSSCIINADPSG